MLFQMPAGPFLNTFQDLIPCNLQIRPHFSTSNSKFSRQYFWFLIFALFTKSFWQRYPNEEHQRNTKKSVYFKQNYNFSYSNIQ
jgi:hypothetical protein